MLHALRKDIGRALATYNGKELGIWLYDFRSGAMQRQTFDSHRDRRFLNGLMTMIGDPARFGRGECSLLEMSGQGFSCGGRAGMGSSGGGGGGGGMPPTQGGQLGCMTAAAMQAGQHGRLSCMVKHGGGKGRFDPNKAHPALTVSVLDKFCAGKTSEDSDYGGFLNRWSSDHPNADDVGESILSRIFGWLLGGKQGNGSSGSGSGGGGKLRQWTEEDTRALLREQRQRNAAMHQDRPLRQWTEEDTQALLEEQRKRNNIQGSRGYSADGAGTGACSSATNAMVRANALFNCSGAGSGAPGRLAGAGPKGPGTRIMPAPGSSGSGGGGLMACAVQGGGLVRTSMNDSRCQQAMCTPGQTCSCNGRGVSATPEMREAARRSVFRPSRTLIRDSGPDGRGGIPGTGGGAGGGSGPTAPGGKGPRGGGYR